MFKLPSVSIIIVNYNGKKFVGECLDSVLQSNYPDFEIIIVDNASTDGSWEFLKKKYSKNKKIKLFCSKTQLYFTGGSNFGAKHVVGEKLIFLNSDTTVEKNWIKKLARFSKNQPKYLVQPKILRADSPNIIDNAGGRYPFWGLGFGLGQGEVDKSQYDKNRRVDFVNGTAFMIDRKFFTRLGGFDESFRFFYEDVDLCLRAQKHGGSCWCCPASIVYHRGGLSFRGHINSREQSQISKENRLATIRKNFRGKEKTLRLGLAKTVNLALTIKDLLFFNFSLKQTILKNTFWLMMANGILKIPTFFLGIFIIRYLGPENYGKFTFAFAFAAFFAPLADLGLATLTVREVAKNKNRAQKYLENLLSLRLLLGLITLILTWGMIRLLGKPVEVETLVVFLAIFIFISAFLSFFQAIFQAFEKMEYLALSQMAYAFSLVPITLFVIWQNLGILGIAKGYLYTGLLTLSVTIILIRKKFFKFNLKSDRNFWLKTLKNAWPFALIAVLAGASIQITTIQINLIAGHKQTGWYNSAYQFIFILTTLGGIFWGSFFPTLSRQYARSKKKFFYFVDYFAKKTILFSFLVCFCFFLIAEKAILFLLGFDYLSSIAVLRLLLISTFILFINTTYSEALKIMNRQREYLKALSGGVLVNFLLNFPLIFWWGGLGASLATLFSSSLVTILMIAKFKKFKKMDLLE